MTTHEGSPHLLIDLFAERVEDSADGKDLQFSTTRLGDGQTNPDE
jgi:hypothetical protein